MDVKQLIVDLKKQSKDLEKVLNGLRIPPRRNQMVQNILAIELNCPSPVLYAISHVLWHKSWCIGKCKPGLDSNGICFCARNLAMASDYVQFDLKPTRKGFVSCVWEVDRPGFSRRSISGFVQVTARECIGLFERWLDKQICLMNEWIWLVGRLVSLSKQMEGSSLSKGFLCVELQLTTDIKYIFECDGSIIAVTAYVDGPGYGKGAVISNPKAAYRTLSKYLRKVFTTNYFVPFPCTPVWNTIQE